MKKTLSILFVSIAYISSFCLVSAQTAEPAGTISEAVTIATININYAQIISQEDRDLTIAFNISNGTGSQPQVKYAVQLTQVLAKSEPVVDEQVYPDVLSMDQNTILKKTIDYSVPDLFPPAHTRSGLKVKIPAD